jgi:tetratricopeptide (TPR) repeat protein
MGAGQTMLHDRLRIVLAALLAVFASAAHAEWAAYTSKNFTLFSDAPQSQVLELLRDFEEYRRVALAVMSLPDVADDQALKIVYPTRSADFRVFGASDNIAGFFYHGEFGPRIAIRSAASRWGVGASTAASADRQTLYHEYVHYLMDQRSGLNYPPWYREGIATVLMMIEPAESTINVGMPPRVEWRRIGATVEDIVDTDYDGEIDEFYVMSWLLTHYLTIDAVDKPQRRQQMADYLRRYNAGENPLEAFKASFATTAADMQRAVEVYRQQRTLKVLRVPRFQYTGGVTKRALEEGEELYLLGDVAVELYEGAAALDKFDEFDKRYGDSPLRFKVMGRRAVALGHEDRYDEGNALVEQIVALNLDDGDVFADVAHYFHDRFQVQSRENDAGASASLERSIHYGELAVERNARDLEALFYLGRAYGFGGNYEMATRTLLRAFRQAPGAEDINFSLARVLYQSGNTRDAILLITRNYSATHSADSRKRYGELLQQMKDGKVDHELLDP